MSYLQREVCANPQQYSYIRTTSRKLNNPRSSPWKYYPHTRIPKHYSMVLYPAFIFLRRISSPFEEKLHEHLKSQSPFHHLAYSQKKKSFENAGYGYASKGGRNGDGDGAARCFLSPHHHRRRLHLRTLGRISLESILIQLIDRRYIVIVNNNPHPVPCGS